MITDAERDELRQRARAQLRSLSPLGREDIVTQALVVKLADERSLSVQYRRTVSQLISDAAPSYARELRRLNSLITTLLR
jgi:sirohydrochlorin ferrochelatase